VDDDSQSDLLLSILRQIEDGSITAEDIPTAECIVSTETSSAQSTTLLVGPAATELESIKELIKFDHIYYKSDTSVESKADDCNVNIVVEYQDVDSASLVTEEVVTAAGSVIDLSDSDTSCENSDDVPIDSSCEIDLDLSEISTPDISSDKTDTELDLDSLLDLQSIDWNSIAFDVDSLVQSDDNCADISTSSSDNDTQNAQHSCSRKFTITLQDPSSVSRKRKRSVISPVSPSHSLTPQLPDELLGFDFATTKTTVSESSGYGSDLSNAGSPYSDLSAADDDSDLWQDSFTELFPSLV